MTITTIIASSLSLVAQQKTDSLTQVNLDEVVVSATRAGKNAPVAYSNLNKDEITKNNAGNNIPFVLQTLPSMVAFTEGGTALGNTSFRIRGTGSNRINITLNGMPLNNPESQDVYWVNLPDLSSSLQSIQIQRGVGTASNGAASFGGSISMQTLGGRPKPYGEASTAIGSYNAFSSTIAAGTGIMKNGLSIDGRYSRATGDGYIRNGWVNHKNGLISVSYYGDNQLIKLLYMKGIQHTGITWEGISPEKMQIDRRYNKAGEYKDEAGKVHYYDNESDNYYSDIAQIIYSSNLKDNLVLNANISYNHGYGYYENYKEDQAFTDYHLPIQDIDGVSYEISDMIIRELMKNDFYSGNISLSYTSGILNITTGGMYSYYDGDHYGRMPWIMWNDNIISNNEWYRNTGKKRDMNAFLKAQFRATEALTISSEIQERYIDYRMKGLDDDFVDLNEKKYYNFINPKIGISYQFDSNNEGYASFGIANREPLRADLKNYAKSNEEIKSERLYDYELGYRYTSEQLSFESNLYYMKYKDQLVQTGKLSSVGYKLQENVPNSYRMGLELSVAYTPAHWLRIDANTAFSRNKIKDYTSYYILRDNQTNWTALEKKSDFYKSTDISFSPNIVGSGIITFIPTGSLSFSFINKYVGSMYYNNRAEKDSKQDAYFVANFMGQYSFKYQNIGTIDLRLFINNYLNNRYVANAWIDDSKFEDGSVAKGLYPQATRNIMAQICIRF